jgi:hypothetical protein
MRDHARGCLHQLGFANRIGGGQIGHDHLCTVISQGLAIGRTQQTGAPSDDHDFACEIESILHVVSSVSKK